MFGFSLGYDAYQSEEETLVKIFEECIKGTGIKPINYSDYKNGLEVKQLTKADESYFTFLNSSDKEVVINFEEKILESYGDIKKQSNKIAIAPLGCGIIKVTK